MNTTIIEKFAETLERYPDKCAVVQDDRRVTFAELGSLSAKLQKTISAGTSIKKKIIGVLLPKSLELVAADLAILSGGAAFMNLDCKLPAARIGAVISHVEPFAIITNTELAEKYRTCFGASLVYCIDQIDVANMNVALSLHVEDMIDTDPFCVINTSGSTGTPKAVILNQLSFYDFLAWTDEVYGLDFNEIIGCLSPVYFDHFVFEICFMMFRGATLVLLDAKYAAFPMELLKKVKSEQVSFIFWVPTIMVNIANQKLLDEIELPAVKRVWFAGEVFPTKQFNYWFDKLPQAQFTNLYGPTETSVDCTYYILQNKLDENESLPIGYPCHNTDILILNDENLPCGPMEEGELCVRGSSLALGYYNDLDRTQKAFTQNPLNTKYPERIYRTGDIVYRKNDGTIMFIGRKDSLIKHSGYRIELGEIEHILVNRCGLAKNCCAVYPKTKKEIVMFYEADEEIDRVTFHKELSKFLPKYMIPKIFIRKESMPQNPNGKIDRHKLTMEAEQQ